MDPLRSASRMTRSSMTAPGRRSQDDKKATTSYFLLVLSLRSSTKCWPRSCPSKLGHDTRPTHLSYCLPPTCTPKILTTNHQPLSTSYRLLLHPIPQSAATSKGQRPDPIPQRLDERTALRAYRRKKNNGASHKKNDISSIFHLSSLVYILY